MATFVVFVLASRSTGQQLTSARAFTALSLITLLATPINTLLRTIPSLNSALACFSRIQAFLEADALQQHVLALDDATIQASVNPTLSSGVVTRDIELEPLSLEGRRALNPTMIDVRNASFSWTNNSVATPTINDLSFSVPRHKFVFLVGPVGCGKSTLLKGLMSETPSCKGFVYSNASEIAFVDQTPWVQNLTIRQNIVGQSHFDETWYERIVRVCALDQDIDIMPHKDGLCDYSRVE